MLARSENYATPCKAPPMANASPRMPLFTTQDKSHNCCTINFCLYLLHTCAIKLHVLLAFGRINLLI